MKTFAQIIAILLMCFGGMFACALLAHLDSGHYELVAHYAIGAGFCGVIGSSLYLTASFIK